MDSTDYQLKVSTLIEKAKSKGLIKTYSEFCNSNYSEEFAINEEIYYLYFLCISDFSNCELVALASREENFCLNLSSSF